MWKKKQSPVRNVNLKLMPCGCRVRCKLSDWNINPKLGNELKKTLEPLGTENESILFGKTSPPQDTPEITIMKMSI